ncbi:hypothetical protein D9M72_654700 [compost metagenome]
MLVGEQLVAIRRVDAVEIRVEDHRARDPHMHFACTGLPHHLHDLHRRRATHDRIIDQNDALAFDHRAVG